MYYKIEARSIMNHSRHIAIGYASIAKTYTFGTTIVK